MFTFKRKSKSKKKRSFLSSKREAAKPLPPEGAELTHQEVMHLLRMGCLGQFNLPVRILCNDPPPTEPVDPTQHKAA